MRHDSGGQKGKDFFFSVMSGKDKYSPEDHLRIIKNQPNPFPWIAVLAPENKVMVLHSIQHFTAPFEYYYPNDGNILAFVHDTFKENGIPAVHKIPINMFKGVKEWFHPNMKTLMSKDPADCDVLPVPEEKDMVRTSRIAGGLVQLVSTVYCVDGAGGLTLPWRVLLAIWLVL